MVLHYKVYFSTHCCVKLLSKFYTNKKRQVTMLDTIIVLCLYLLSTNPKGQIASSHQCIGNTNLSFVLCNVYTLIIQLRSLHQLKGYRWTRLLVYNWIKSTVNPFFIWFDYLSVPIKGYPAFAKYKDHFLFLSFLI